MTFLARPISFKPPRLKGLSPRLTASHYENNYGGAVRRPERNPRRAGHPRPGRRTGLSPQRAEARGTDRHQLDAAARSLFRQSRRRRWWRSNWSAWRSDRARFRLDRQVARRVRGHGQGPGRRLRAGCC